MLDEDAVDTMRYLWLQEARAEARQQNPLIGYCERVYFERTTCRRRSGPKKGTKRRRREHEVELMRILPSGKCVTVKDMETPGLDALAEEVFTAKAVLVPPDVNKAQLFLDYFRAL